MTRFARRSVPLMLCGALLFVVSASHANTQERRSRTAGGATPEFPSIPRNTQLPFVGSWVGQRAINGDVMPMGLTIQIINDKYSGVIVMPDGGQALQQNPRQDGSEYQWTSPNNGGGVWTYVARHTVGDSLVGTWTLTGVAPPPGMSAKGTFALVRKPN